LRPRNDDLDILHPSCFGQDIETRVLDPPLLARVPRREEEVDFHLPVTDLDLLDALVRDDIARPADVLDASQGLEDDRFVEHRVLS
jgi:hypothetical protein